MSFIRYKPSGDKIYAYEVTSYWDKEKKTSRQKVEYLGAVDENNSIISKKKQAEASLDKKEKLILDYGDTFAVNEVLKSEKCGLLNLFNEVLDKSEVATLLTLINYRLHGNSAMCYAQNWFDGNIARILYKSANVSSQSISKFLQKLGNEELQRNFWNCYLPKICGEKTGLLIDSTDLPNDITFPLNAWGDHNGSVEKESKCLMVVEQKTYMPLYFRYMAGNISDVSTLETTILELNKLGVDTKLAIVDAGYFSEKNIKDFYSSNISFITRLPASRKIYKTLINDNYAKIENWQNAVTYNKRGLFVKKVQIDLFGQNGFAYIVLDPVRRGRELSKALTDALEDKLDLSETQELAKNYGVMILVSNCELPIEDAVPLYYTRQMAERLFCISKDDLNLLPLRVHSEVSFRGFLFLIFLSLIAYLHIKNLLGKSITVEDALSTLRNLKAKIFDDSIIVSEISKQQKTILAKLNVLVSKSVGV